MRAQKLNAKEEHEARRERRDKSENEKRNEYEDGSSPDFVFSYLYIRDTFPRPAYASRTDKPFGSVALSACGSLLRPDTRTGGKGPVPRFLTTRRLGALVISFQEYAPNKTCPLVSKAHAIMKVKLEFANPFT